MGKFSEHVVVQRFKKVYFLLLEQGLIKGKSDIAEKLETYNHVVNGILKGKRNVTIDQLNNLFVVYNVNANYLFGLSDEMFLDAAAPDELPTYSTHQMDVSGKRNIRLIEEVAAFAGDAIDLNNIASLANMPSFSLPGMEGNLFAIRVHGDSMTPTITNGDLIIAELLEPNDPLRNNQVYVIVTDTAVAKRVQQIQQGGATVGLTLISDNDTVYKPYDVTMDAVRHILRVKARLTDYGMR